MASHVVPLGQHSPKLAHRAPPREKEGLPRGLDRYAGGPLPPKIQRLVIKFGPIALIVTLLFAVKYLLLAIHFNIHSIRSDIQDQCNTQLNMSNWGQSELSKNEHWLQYKMLGRGTYGFVQWSAYRTSASDITAIGFGAVLLREHREVTACMWHGHDGRTIPGQPELLYPHDKSNTHQYEVVLLTCKLQGRVTTHLGGYMVATVDKEHVVAYREEKNSLAHTGSADVPDYKATMCTFPIGDPVDGERMREWVDIHRYIGAEHVVGYDAGGMDKAAAVHLQSYIREGFLEITPMKEISHFDIFSHGANLAIQDCLYRSKLHSSWIIFLDWDDFLYLQSPKYLSILLDDHKETPYMSFGTRIFGTKKCSKNASPIQFRGTASGLLPFPIEQMVFHWPHFLCGDEGAAVDKAMCPDERGMRYFIVNPTKVASMRKHEIVEPAEGGVVLSAEDVRHDRFEGIHKIGAPEKWCEELQSEANVDWWQRGLEMQELAQEVRRKLAAGWPLKQS